MAMQVLKVQWANSSFDRWNVQIIGINFSAPAYHAASEISLEIENHTDDDYDNINEDDNDEDVMMTMMMINTIIKSFFKVKPVWLAEIGTRTAEAWDGTSWRSIPSLSRAKVPDTQGSLVRHQIRFQTPHNSKSSW